MSTDKTASPSSTPTENLSKILGSIQNMVTIALGLGAFLTAAGVVVVNVHLSKFTDIHGIILNSNLYLPAGIGLLIILLIANFIFYIANIIIDFFWDLSVRRRRRFMIVVILVIIIQAIIATMLDRDIKNFMALFASTSVVLVLLSVLDKPLFQILQRPFSKIGIYVLLVFTIYAIVGGYFYASATFEYIPRYLGGGKPTSALLVFKNSNELKQFGFYADPSMDSHTQHTLILADLVDGLLVLDQTSGRVIAVKNESLLGIIDDQVNQALIITAIPNSTPTSTLGSTNTPSPISTLVP